MLKDGCRVYVGIQGSILKQYLFIEKEEIICQLICLISTKQQHALRDLLKPHCIKQFICKIQDQAAKYVFVVKIELAIKC